MMRKTRFSIGNGSDDPIYVGYSDGTDWNGFANPYFTLEVAQQVLKHYQNQSCKESREQWLNWDLKPSKNFDGQDLYFFGGGFIWVEADTQEKLEEILETITSEILLKDLTVFYPEKYEEIVPFLRNEIIKQLKEVK